MSGRDQGFTLLEVLLAVAVLGVVMAMLSLSLSGTLRVVDATQQQEVRYHQAQVALRRLSEDLTAAVLTSEKGFVGLKNERDGQRADTLAFASLAHLVLNPEQQRPGVAAISYQIRADGEDQRRLRLLRADTPLLPGAEDAGPVAVEEAYLLADNLRSVRFGFTNSQGQVFDSWQGGLVAEEQAEPLALPALVSCTLEFWLDPDQGSSQTFTTGVLIPAGLVTATPAKDTKAKDANLKDTKVKDAN